MPDRSLREDSALFARCVECGHVGDRAFRIADDGHWRDVLGSLRVDHCMCSRCCGQEFEMVEDQRA